MPVSALAGASTFAGLRFLLLVSSGSSAFFLDAASGNFSGTLVSSGAAAGQLLEHDGQRLGLAVLRVLADHFQLDLAAGKLRVQPFEQLLRAALLAQERDHRLVEAVLDDAIARRQLRLLCRRLRE